MRLMKDILERIKNEISFTTKLNAHKNILKIMGCCLEIQIPILVYDHQVNGIVPLYDLIHHSRVRNSISY